MQNRVCTYRGKGDYKVSAVAVIYGRSNFQTFCADFASFKSVEQQQKKEKYTNVSQQN